MRMGSLSRRFQENRWRNSNVIKKNTLNVTAWRVKGRPPKAAFVRTDVINSGGGCGPIYGAGFFFLQPIKERQYQGQAPG